MATATSLTTALARFTRGGLVRKIMAPPNEKRSQTGRGTFPFLSLPAELRNMVYFYYHESPVIWVKDTKSRIPGQPLPDTLLSNVFSLCCINRQIRQEALDYLFSTKTVMLEQRLFPQLRDTLPLEARNALTSLKIHQFDLRYVWSKSGEKIEYYNPKRVTHRCWRLPLTTQYPRLKSIEVRLARKRTCLMHVAGKIASRARGRHSHKRLKIGELIEAPGMKWLRGNRGLNYFKFNAIGPTCKKCWVAQRGKCEQLLAELDVLVRAEVVS
ncbi:hypothetical protein NA57DRAFT_80483 [Rhizodiscina lignyota]|uniref:F-box domain-containing protein n=1 Tax=Rhizodiscina lignyota TaxID=1504668 RepID=A0A9P4M493_9PEZI|nr:hypothetical protein NA57DRAFT_80483 [Rhizodiscina lignyota]